MNHNIRFPICRSLSYIAVFVAFCKWKLPETKRKIRGSNSFDLYRIALFSKQARRAFSDDLPSSALIRIRIRNSTSEALCDIQFHYKGITFPTSAPTRTRTEIFALKERAVNHYDHKGVNQFSKYLRRESNPHFTR